MAIANGKHCFDTGAAPRGLPNDSWKDPIALLREGGVKWSFVHFARCFASACIQGGSPMLTMLDADRAARAIIRNNADDDALRLVAPLCRLFGLAEMPDVSADLVQFIAEFQRSRGLAVDGVIGPATRRHLAPVAADDLAACDALWPDVAGERARACYAGLCEAAGFHASGRPTLLALRGVWLFGRKVHPVWHAPLYDDAFILLTDNAAPVTFRGATHPYQVDSSASADLDRDGRKDVGMVRPGNYVLEATATEPPIFKVLTQEGKAQIPVYRDTNHNARIDELEKRASETASRGEQVIPGIGAFGTEILLHPGYDTLQPHKKAPFSSIGCQTAPVEALRQVLSAGRTIDFVLVDAVDLLPALAAVVDVA
jgi:hypothetical protein